MRNNPQGKANENMTTTIPTELLQGAVIMVRHEGRPRFVFVEHATPKSLANLRAVQEVRKEGEGQFTPIGARNSYDGDESDATQIAIAFADQAF